MMEENNFYSSGDPVNKQLLKENGMALAQVIKDGTNPAKK